MATYRGAYAHVVGHLLSVGEGLCWSVCGQVSILSEQFNEVLEGLLTDTHTVRPLPHGTGPSRRQNTHTVIK